MQRLARACATLALALASSWLGSSPAAALVASDVCTGDPCVITANHTSTDPFTTLDFGSAAVILQSSLNVASNSLDILAGSFTISQTGKITAQVASSSESGGSVSVVAVGDIMLNSANQGGAIVANGCNGGFVTLESATGTIGGNSGNAINANRVTACLLSGEGGTIELIAASVDLSGNLNAIGGVAALGGSVIVDSSDLVRLGPINVSGGEGDGGILDVVAGGAVTLGTVSANSIGNIGTGGTVSVSSGGPLTILGDLDALGGNGASEGDAGGDVSLRAGNLIQPRDILVTGRIRANGQGQEGAGGFIDIDGALVTIEDPLIANGQGTFSSGGSIDVFGADSVTVTAPVSAGIGGLGTITIQAVGDLNLLAAADAGASPGTNGGDVTLIAGGSLDISGDVFANGNGPATFGGQIFASGCEIHVPSTTQLNASNEAGTVQLAAGQQMTIAGDLLAGPTLGTIVMRHRRASLPPVTVGASFNITPLISLDPSIAPCAICTFTGDADSDGVDDSCDRCTMVSDPLQTDTDGDGFGNACDCDFDQTGQCGIADFNVFQADFTTSIDAGTGTDMDGSGVVGIGDFNLFLPGFTSAVPGPSAMAP